MLSIHLDHFLSPLLLLPWSPCLGTRLRIRILRIRIRIIRRRTLRKGWGRRRRTGLVIIHKHMIVYKSPHMRLLVEVELFPAPIPMFRPTGWDWARAPVTLGERFLSSLGRRRRTMMVCRCRRPLLNLVVLLLIVNECVVALKTRRR